MATNVTPLDPPVRVHRLAHEFNLTSRAIQTIIREATGYAPPSASTALPPIFADMIRDIVYGEKVRLWLHY
jgi:hypothetical protein